MLKFQALYESVFPNNIPYEIVDIENNHMTIILKESFLESVTMSDLLRGTESEIINKSKTLKTISVKVFSDGILVFKVVSQTEPNT